MIGIIYTYCVKTLFSTLKLLQAKALRIVVLVFCVGMSYHSTKRVMRGAPASIPYNRRFRRWEASCERRAGDVPNLELPGWEQR